MDGDYVPNLADPNSIVRPLAPPSAADVLLTSNHVILTCRFLDASYLDNYFAVSFSESANLAGAFQSPFYYTPRQYDSSFSLAFLAHCCHFTAESL
jgi:hypothetical protein